MSVALETKKLYSEGSIDKVNGWKTMLERGIMVDEAKWALYPDRDTSDKKIVVGLFDNYTEVKQALGALNRHRFVKQDVVRVIDQDKASPEDAVEGVEDRLEQTLSKLSIPTDKVDSYAQKIRDGATLVAVKTQEDRAEEALNIMRHADADRMATQPLEDISPENNQ